MLGPSITDWITSGASALAAIAAFVAAYQAKRSADEAAKASKAASLQVELQRPRPIVIVVFSRSFSDKRGNMADNDQTLKIVNIGNSPAFDVEVSTLEVGGTRLSTAKIAYLVQRAPAECTHKLEPARGATGILGPAAMFLQDAKVFFDNQSRTENIQSNFRHTVPFAISYRALDGRQFNQPYVFVVDFMQMKGWAEATSSLLENVPPAPKYA